jgi:hypothetical protein
MRYNPHSQDQSKQPSHHDPYQGLACKSCGEPITMMDGRGRPVCSSCGARGRRAHLD